MQHLTSNGSRCCSEGVLVWATFVLEPELPSSPVPKLLSTMSDDSESGSALLIIFELLLVDILLPMRGMIFFPFEELID
jgi:hypothetical protein